MPKPVSNLYLSYELLKNERLKLNQEPYRPLKINQVPSIDGAGNQSVYPALLDQRDAR
jgi:hypothetical protein